MKYVKGFLEKITESEDKVKNFIFYTNEGFTFQPGSEEDLPEVENCQVLGWGRGRSSEEAFKKFKDESRWLRKLKFSQVIGSELKDERRYYFELK